MPSARFNREAVAAAGSITQISSSLDLDQMGQLHFLVLEYVTVHRFTRS